VIVFLNCQHTAEFVPAPKLGERLYCSRCQEYRVYIKSLIQYSIKCTVCRRNKRYGADRTTAYRDAIKHVRRNVTHGVRVVKDGKLEQLISQETESIPGIDVSVNDWLRLNPTHQSSLKSLNPSNSDVSGKVSLPSHPV
jgi:hypothetical protein